MKTLKVMSIIGIVFLSLCLLLIFSWAKNDIPAAIGVAVISLLYAIPFCIVALVQSIKSQASTDGDMDKLIKLSELKEKGILTDIEFNKRKATILR